MSKRQAISDRKPDGYVHTILQNVINGIPIPHATVAEKRQGKLEHRVWLHNQSIIGKHTGIAQRANRKMVMNGVYLVLGPCSPSDVRNRKALAKLRIGGALNQHMVRAGITNG